MLQLLSHPIVSALNLSWSGTSEKTCKVMHFYSLQQEWIALNMPIESVCRWPEWEKEKKKKTFVFIWIVVWFICLHTISSETQWTNASSLFSSPLYNTSCDRVEKLHYLIVYFSENNLVCALWICWCYYINRQASSFQANKYIMVRWAFFVLFDRAEKPHLRRLTLERLCLIYCGQEHSRSLSKSIEFPPKISASSAPSSISKAIFIHPTDRSSGTDQHTCFSVLRERGRKNWSSYINVSLSRTVQWAPGSLLAAPGPDRRPTQKPTSGWATFSASIDFYELEGRWRAWLWFDHPFIEWTSF